MKRTNRTTILALGGLTAIEGAATIHAALNGDIDMAQITGPTTALLGYATKSQYEQGLTGDIEYSSNETFSEETSAQGEDIIKLDEDEYEVKY